MESRVVWSLGMLCVVLVMVYRAFFRSMDGFVTVPVATSPFAALDTNSEYDTFITQNTDPFRDKAEESTIPDTRVQVLNPSSSSTNTAKISSVVPLVSQEPVVIDGLRFHATTDLFNQTSGEPTNAIPSMYLRQGQQKILSYLGLAHTTKIIYKDVHNTHFCLLSSFDSNQWKIAVEKIGGSLLAIPSQIDRNNHGLLGDYAYIVTIPKYRTTKMIYLLQVQTDWRYIQIDKDWYDSGGKDFVKNAFSLYYKR